MYISRIVVRGYRSFTHLDVKLSPGVTCIIGENNTGKTNLLHAIRLVADKNLSSRWRELTEHDINSGLDIRSPSQVVVSVEFADYSSSINSTALVGCWEVTPGVARLTYRFRPTPSVRESLEANELMPGDLTLEDYRWEITGGGSGDPAIAGWDEEMGSSVSFSHLQTFQVIFLPALRDAPQDLAQRRASPLSRLFSTSDISEDERDQMISIVRAANAQLAESATIRETGGAIQDAFADSAGEAFKMGIHLGMADPSFASISSAITILLSDEGLSEFEAERNGLGLNNVLYISMLMKYFERRIASPDTAGQLLLLEEPEAHLHPQLQRVLYGALATKPFQTIITSHSTHVSSRAPLKSTIVLTKTQSQGSASTVPGASGMMQENEIADLERYLDATRSTILFARKVMLVEGPAELFLIPPLVKQVMHVDLDRLGISVVPIYGTHFGAYTKLFTDHRLPKRCAIVADGDITPEELQTEDGSEDVLLLADLRALEMRNVKVFQCVTTFEKALAEEGLLPLLAAAMEEIGATRGAQRIGATLSSLADGSMNSDTGRATLEEIGEVILRTAIRYGKARFAQVASKHAHLANTVPEYIRRAVEWLVS